MIDEILVGDAEESPETKTNAKDAATERMTTTAVRQSEFLLNSFKYTDTGSTHLWTGMHYDDIRKVAEGDAMISRYGATRMEVGTLTPERERKPQEKKTEE